MPSIVRDRHCPLRECLFSAVASVAFLLALVGATQTPGKEPAYRPDTCIFGDKHKSTPSPEGTKANYRYRQSNKSPKDIAPDIIMRTTMELVWQVAHTHTCPYAHVCVAVYVPLALTWSCTDDSFKTCHLWKEGACCSAEFTQQLDADVVTNIDGFYWNHCGNFTPACQRSVACSLCMFPCVTTVSDSGCITTYIIYFVCISSVVV